MENKPQIMSEEQTYLQPDPAWDYYEVWNFLLRTKSLIDQTLELMKTQERANPDCDHQIQEYVLQMERMLGNIEFDIDDYA
jgi:hypothetical protein